jgi:hypothetical protein
VGTDEQPVLASRLRAHGVVEDRPWRDIEHVGQRADRLDRRARQVLWDEPSHRSAPSCSAIPS